MISTRNLAIRTEILTLLYRAIECPWGTSVEGTGTFARTQTAISNENGMRRSRYILSVIVARAIGYLNHTTYAQIGQTVRLRFQLRNADLFAFWTE